MRAFVLPAWLLRRAASTDGSALAAYNWAGSLAGPRLGKLPAYVVGWVTMLALFGGISTSVQASNQIVAMHMMFTYGEPSAATTQTGQWAIAEACNLVGVAVSLMPIHYTDKLASLALAWLLVGSLVLIVVIPSVAPVRQPASYVWGTFYNGNYDGIQEAGLPSTRAQDGYTVCCGLLMSQFLLLYYDTPSHMAEEVHHSTYTVPRSILASFFIGSALNFGLLLSYLYSIQDENNVLVPGRGISGTSYGTAENPVPYSLVRPCMHMRAASSALASSGAPSMHAHAAASSDADCCRP